MWPDRRLVELFEIEHPIVLAPMAGFATVELAAAVADAGGLGSIGCATMNPQFAVETIARMQRLTSKPININFFRHDPAKADDAFASSASGMRCTQLVSGDISHIPGIFTYRVIANTLGATTRRNPAL
jgi:NAD(P)H-dependent flavin oxidoreductase YrpB (nitropropane dioxygenase family)